MNFTYIKEEIEKIIIPKYKGKMKELTKFQIEADVQQVLARLRKNGSIKNYTIFRAHIINGIVNIYGDVFIPSGKIKVRLELEL